MAKHYKTWDRFAKRYAKSPVKDEKSYQKKLEITRGYLKPDMGVMEFGCGTGSTAIALAPYVKSIQAVDFSKKMVAIAQIKALKVDVLNVDFMRFSIAGYPAKGPVFDVVMAHSVLHLLADKDAAIAKAFEMLKPGGYFISSTVCMGSKFNPLRYILPIGTFLGLLPLVSFFSAQNLEAAMQRAGFAIDHRWQVNDGQVLFLVAQKPA